MNNSLVESLKSAGKVLRQRSFFVYRLLMIGIILALGTSIHALEFNIVSAAEGGEYAVADIIVFKNNFEIVRFSHDGYNGGATFSAQDGDYLTVSVIPYSGIVSYNVYDSYRGYLIIESYSNTSTHTPYLLQDYSTMEIYTPITGATFSSGSTINVSHSPKTIVLNTNMHYNYWDIPYNWLVFFSHDAGINWEYITSTTGADGNVTITAPIVNSSQCRVKFVLENWPGSGNYSWSSFNVSSDDFSVYSDPSAPRLALSYPSDEGIYLNAGSDCNISWTRYDVGTVDIDLSTNGGQSWSEIATNINADCYQWTVPDIITSDARIRIHAVNDSTIVYYSAHPFTIYNLQLLNPIGGELWMGGSTKMITWNNPSNFPLELLISFDGGNNWSSVTTFSATQGIYYYTVPSVNSTQCKMKLQNTSQNDIMDESNGVFQISTNPTLPKLVLSYPSASGIHWQVGQNVTLTWTRQNVGEVALDISIDNGYTWTEIATGIDANAYTWPVSDNPSSSCRIAVRSVANSTVSDISDNAFSISKLQILSPLGGEMFTSDYSNGYSMPITWSAAAMANVKIEYSSNGGASWVSINNSYNAALGTFNWVLPGIPSTNYKIRIANTANTAIYSVSESFTLRNPIKLSNANGGGFVTNGSLFNIRWLNQDVDPIWSVWWEYSLNNSTWTRIYTNPTPVGNQQLTWFVSTGLDNSVWLRAINSSDNRIIGKSEASFTVTDKSLVIWAPTGGEEYNALSTQTITWEAQGCSDFNISLSTDDGVSWNNIATNVPSSQLTYQWLVPETPSVNCRIRLSDVSYQYMNLMSDGSFSIMPLQIVLPTVDFSADILSGDIPLAVQFTEEVNPGVGNIANRLWDFGDGNTSDQANPLHTYTVAGTYTVSLTVINDFEGTTTETKTDYITALPNTPRIELLSASSLNYGVVYLGDTSPTQIIEVKNIGTAPMIISSVSYYLANSQFTLSGTELPITVPVNETTQLGVVFVPISSGAVCDSIYIHSDASNLPALAIKLSAVGEYVPPAAVEGLVVSVIGNDAHLTWQPVNTTIYGTPIEPDGYIVLYNETPYEDEHFYYFHSFVSGTNFVHPFVAQYRTEMFYRIVAVKNYREEALAYLMSLNGSQDRFTWGELREKLNTLKQRQ